MVILHLHEWQNSFVSVTRVVSSFTFLRVQPLPWFPCGSHRDKGQVTNDSRLLRELPLAIPMDTNCIQFVSCNTTADKTKLSGNLERFTWCKLSQLLWENGLSHCKKVDRYLELCA